MKGEYGVQAETTPNNININNSNVEESDMHNLEVLCETPAAEPMEI